MQANRVDLYRIAKTGVSWWPELQENIKHLDENLLCCIVIDAELSEKICRFKNRQIVFDIRETERRLEQFGYMLNEDAIKPFVRMKFGIDLAKLFKKIRKER